MRESEKALLEMAGKGIQKISREAAGDVKNPIIKALMEGKGINFKLGAITYTVGKEKLCELTTAKIIAKNVEKLMEMAQQENTDLLMIHDGFTGVLISDLKEKGGENLTSYVVHGIHVLTMDEMLADTTRVLAESEKQLKKAEERGKELTQMLNEKMDEVVRYSQKVEDSKILRKRIMQKLLEE